MAIDEMKLVEWLLDKKYIIVDEDSTEMTEEFEKEHQWELSRNCFVNEIVRHIINMPKLSLENKTSDKWIPCTERLPKKSGTYLITVYDYEPETVEAHYLHISKQWTEVEGFDTWHNVKAWMEKPEPYKGE